MSQFAGPFRPSLLDYLNSSYSPDQNRQAYIRQSNDWNGANYVPQYFGDILGMYYQQLGLGDQERQRAAQQIPQVMGNYDSALGAITNAGQAARTDVLANQARQFGGAQQSLQNRGLGNTSVLDNLNRGIAFDTNRNLAGIAEQTGQQRAGIYQNRAGAQMGALQYQNSLERNLQDIIARRSGMLQQEYMQYKDQRAQGRNRNAGLTQGYLQMGLGAGAGILGGLL